MAISPQALNETFKKEVDKFEQLIDNILQKKSLSKNGEINISRPAGMTYAHFEILKPKYLSAGWKDLEWYSFYDQRDQYDSTSIIFKS